MFLSCGVGTISSWAPWRSGLYRRQADELEDRVFDKASMAWTRPANTERSARKQQILKAFGGPTGGKSTGDLLMEGPPS